MKLRFSLCLLLLLVTAAALADDPLAKTKQTYDFSNWPGKSGALKQGLALKSLDLAPYEIASVRNRLKTSGEIIFRYRRKGAKKHEFEVAFKVFDSVDGAQEHLLKYLSTCTVKVPKGDTLGLSVGDISFAGKETNSFRNIVFIRNNVFVRVTLIGKTDSQVNICADISDIAGKIDAQIKQEDEVQEAKDLNKPQISEFSAKDETVAPNKPVEITLKVTDPKSEKLEIQFDEGGAMVYEKDGKRYFKAEKPGTYTVTVYVTNEHFLVTKKTITITVEK